MDRPQYVQIGYIRRAHGVRGFVLVESLTDNPARFENLSEVHLERNGARTLLPLEDCTRSSKGWLLKFEGVDTREQAENLKGGYIEVNAQKLPLLEDGTYYVFDLIGMNVFTTSGERLGEITDVQKYPANDLYVVEGERGKLMLPAISDVVKKVDLKRNRVEVELLDGLEFE